MKDELLDIDETGEGKIDSSTLSLINKFKPWMIPMAVSLFILGGLALFASLMLMQNVFRTLGIENIAIFIGFSALGLGAIISGMYIIRLSTLINALSQNPSSYRLNVLLKSISRIFIIKAVAFVTAAFAVLLIVGSALFG